jgi:hypothetical protein
MTIAESSASNRFGWRPVGVVVPALAAIMVLSASDETRVVLGKGAPEGGPNRFNPGPEGGTTAQDSGGAGICPTNQCPPGRATCPDKPFPCQVDLLWDDLNCGACGSTCSKFTGIHARTTCVDGTCALQCEVLYDGTFANCNGLIEDGCEINLSTDENNCGGCGIACAANEECVNAKCVCAVRESCGACGTVCPPPTEPPFPPEWNAGYYCVNAQCNQPSCNPEYGDCNNDFPDAAGDGCETHVSDDPKNCGACGVACEPGEICGDGGCHCPCGATCFTKLDSDPNNCGACGVVCQQLPGVDPVCDQGICEYPCLSSRADCDQRRSNGCEVNIMDDPANCGGCGIRCDGIEGQACVEGRCTMTECQVK